MALSPNTRRKLAYGSNAMLVTAFFVVFVGMLVGLAERHRVRVDLSQDGGAQLTEDTLSKIELIENDGRRIRVTAFTHQQGKTGSYYKNRAIKDFLEELGYRSPNIEWRLVDFDRDRLTAEDLGVKEYGRLVVQVVEAERTESSWSRVDVKARELFRTVGRGDERRFEFLGESVFNRTIAQLLSDKKQTVYSLIRHRERDVERADPSGLSELVLLLGQENYDLKSLDLYESVDGVVAPKVPDDADALLIASPQAPLSDVEDAAVMDFVARGGALMVFLDPQASVPGILTRLDIGLHSGVVMDEKLVFPYNDRPVARYRAHPITTSLEEGRLLTVLAHIAPLRPPGDPPPWLKWSPLLETGRSGWVERGGDTLGGVAQYDPAIDAMGPAQNRFSPPLMAMAVEVLGGEKSIVGNKAGKARLIVVGDSDFASNQNLHEAPGNAAFLINAFRWMLRDDLRLGVASKGSAVRKLALTVEDHDRIRWLSLGLMPFLVGLLGFLVWSSRRGR